jgi:uncharacterized repeat protein (TIGR03803 family)
MISPSVAARIRTVFSGIGVFAVLLCSLHAFPQTLTVLHAFAGPPSDGLGPMAGLVMDPSGNLYGTTANGGTVDGGIVFKVDSLGVETVLHSFGDQVFPDGWISEAALVLDSVGNMYGTTTGGGGGTVFEVGPTGSERVLHRFVYPFNLGGLPTADLVFDKQGNLYGTTWGATGFCELGICGDVFKLGRDGKYTVLYTFDDGAQGSNPLAGVILDDEGNIYGTTSLGGTGNCRWQGDYPGCGTVFKLDRKGKLTVLHSFQGGTDGECPAGDLVRDAEGNLYGTTFGSYSASSCDFFSPFTGYGTVFKIDKHGKETVLHTFQNGNDGAYPAAGLTRDGQGNLYGTTESGTIFEIDSSGAETVLYQFSGGTDGRLPMSRLVRDAEGNLYGTTWQGGEYGWGVVFKLSPAAASSRAQ